MIFKRTKTNPRNVTLLIATVLALGTGVLLFNYLSSVNVAANRVEAKRVVLVAAQAIPAQSTITAEMLDRAIRPASSIEPDSVDPGQIQSVVGSIALVAIPAGGTLTQSRIARPSTLGLAEKIRPGLRAVTIPIDHVKGIAGLIETGDRVDVIAIVPPGPDGFPNARTVLRGITVLAIGTATTTLPNVAPVLDGNQNTATLEVTPQQADLLSFADVNTTLRLALRSPNEPAGSLPVEPISIARGAPVVPSAAPIATSATPARAPAAQRKSSGPIIIDGDKITAPELQ